jgi:hypothetical protein
MDYGGGGRSALGERVYWTEKTYQLGVMSLVSGNLLCIGGWGSLTCYELERFRHAFLVVRHCGSKI